MSNAEADRQSYQTWQIVQQYTESPLDDTPAYWRYIIAAYPYYRSRIYVPGRAYDSEEDGMLAIGGSAHCDVMSLDVKLKGCSKEEQQTAIEWMGDSSHEEVDYWRKLGRGSPARSLYRKRAALVDNLNGTKAA